MTVVPKVKRGFGFAWIGSLVDDTRALVKVQAVREIRSSNAASMLGKKPAASCSPIGRWRLSIPSIWAIIGL
ncbi:MAG: hypothetical protein IJ087_09060 [Eggerthellaceae bacterium]|nr:hypothetical protein [Eggerthellaceae bacterium]